MSSESLYLELGNKEKELTKEIDVLLCLLYEMEQNNHLKTETMELRLSEAVKERSKVKRQLLNIHINYMNSIS